MPKFCCCGRIRDDAEGDVAREKDSEGVTRSQHAAGYLADRTDAQRYRPLHALSAGHDQEKRISQSDSAVVRERQLHRRLAPSGELLPHPANPDEPRIGFGRARLLGKQDDWLT
jgi:hypothetical protein